MRINRSSTYINHALRLALKKEKYTIVSFAEAMGMVRTTISRYLHYHYRPTMATLTKMSELLGVPKDKLGFIITPDNKVMCPGRTRQYGYTPVIFTAHSIKFLPKKCRECFRAMRLFFELQFKAKETANGKDPLDF